jgi:hypothetical protein
MIYCDFFCPEISMKNRIPVFFIEEMNETMPPDKINYCFNFTIDYFYREYL